MNDRQKKLLQTQRTESGSVTCLGMSFQSDEERRAFFISKLREKLQDPEFRKISGFPVGSDEAILALSNPPYYTACPNPWLEDAVTQWAQDKSTSTDYHRDPYASDVSEGKSDPIYKAHSYHTKVPHKAVMRYILHYTSPGDVIFDGFCGTGMAGVAAQLCGDRESVESLGFRVDADGSILEQSVDKDGKKVWLAISQLGARKTVLNDLSPAATFIAANYNSPVSAEEFEFESQQLLDRVQRDCGWMYRTTHTDGQECDVDYFVWSEVMACPHCATQMVFSKVALDLDTGKVRPSFDCPGCGSELKKNDLDLVYEERWDSLLQRSHQFPKRELFLIAYRIGKEKFTKFPDESDLSLQRQVEQLEMPDFPNVEMPDMQMMRVGRMQPSKITHLHHFFLRRPILTLSQLWKNAVSINDPTLRSKLLFFVEQSVWGLSVLSRFMPTHFSQVNRYLSGVFYMASHIVDASPKYLLGGKAKRLFKVFSNLETSIENAIVTTQDTTSISLPAESLDYAFVDPPFGENIYYSDLNFLVESLHGVVTNPSSEAIVDRVKGKGFTQYQGLMTNCLRTVFHSLKPGRWLTVEFSNSSAAIWNLIQSAIGDSGFIVANVSALDKKQRSFQSVVSPTAVKQDLVISAYKPAIDLGDTDKEGLRDGSSVWDFVRSHLEFLPVLKSDGAMHSPVLERDPRILFDQMVAYFVRHGWSVPISSQEFQVGLSQRFDERDGLYFLPDQATEYDRARIASSDVGQLSIFVSDESSAIQWLRKTLRIKPQTYSELIPEFMKQLGGWGKNEVQLDLQELLNQNFLRFEGRGPVPEQIHAYLSSNWKTLRNLSKDDPKLVSKAENRWYVPDAKRQGDIEQLRQRALIKEFQIYRQRHKKFGPKDRFRIEALRAGFKEAWQARDYETIVNVAMKLPPKLLEEDPKLLMWYDQAVTRTS